MFRCLPYYLQGEATEEYKVHCLAFLYLLHILLLNVFRSALDSLKCSTFIIALVYATSICTADVRVSVYRRYNCTRWFKYDRD